MAQLLVRDLDERVKARLRLRAAEHGRSMEAEAREILTDAVSPPRESVMHALRRAALAHDGVDDLILSPRTELQRPVDLGA
jgi:plasmid stability protein